MKNSLLMKAAQEIKTLDKAVRLSPDYLDYEDDDDDADDEGDADDEISQEPWRGQRWLSRSEFGSPEWWAQL